MSYQTPMQYSNAEFMPEISPRSPGICRSPTFYGESIRSLLDEFDEEVMYFEQNRPIDSMSVREVDCDDYYDDDEHDYYCEHYTLPEEQLYGYEDYENEYATDTEVANITEGIREDETDDEEIHPNITLRTSRQINIEFDDEDEDAQIHPNVTLRTSRQINIISDDEDEDTQIHPNITVRR